MDILKLEVKARSNDNSLMEIRNGDFIPAVFYGQKKENKNLMVNYQSFRKVFDKAGWNTVIELDIDGKEKINVLVYDLQHDPVTSRFTHIDFKFIDLNKEVTTEVPIVAVGESKAIRELSGIFMQARDVVTVKCMAKIIPHNLEFDISALEDFNSVIHVKDIKLPEGVEIIDDPILTIASVSAPRAEEEAPVAAEEAAPAGEQKAEDKKEEGEKAAS